jgi:CBS domain containing-hemolysin-like protein
MGFRTTAGLRGARIFGWRSRPLPLLQFINMNLTCSRHLVRRPTRWLLACVLGVMLSPAHAHASIFKGEALDKVADVLTWVVLVVAPVVGIAVFLLIHILPEKIAEKKQHPQAKAIQCLCLLSLVFGGLLWPLAWLWAYSKPVLYRMAYGTDKVAPHQEQEAHPPQHNDEAEELRRLRNRVAELETNLARKSAAEGGKA